VELLRAVVDRIGDRVGDEHRISYADAYDALNIAAERQTPQTQRRLRDAMGKLGFRSDQFRRGKDNPRGWVRREAQGSVVPVDEDGR